MVLFAASLGADDGVIAMNRPQASLGKCRRLGRYGPVRSPSGSGYSVTGTPGPLWSEASSLPLPRCFNSRAFRDSSNEEIGDLRFLINRSHAIPMSISNPPPKSQRRVGASRRAAHFGRVHGRPAAIRPVAGPAGFALGRLCALRQGLGLFGCATLVNRRDRPPLGNRVRLLPHAWHVFLYSPTRGSFLPCALGRIANHALSRRLPYRRPARWRFSTDTASSL